MECEEEDEGEGIFECRLSTCHVLTTLLSCLLLDRKDQLAVFVASSRGLKVITEKSRVLQGKVFLGRDSFEKFLLRIDRIAEDDGDDELHQSEEECLEFAVNLSLLYECFGEEAKNAQVKMSYAGYGRPLVLELRNPSANYSTSCQIQTTLVPDLCEFGFRSHEILNRCILKARKFKEALSDLDSVKGATSLLIQVSPSAPHFVLSVSGDAINYEIELLKDSGSDVFTDFSSSCAQVASYGLNLIRSCTKALSRAETVNLRINANRMLSLQFFLHFPSAAGSTHWVDFLICSDCIDDQE
jgi:hypothetical protein